MKNVELVDGSFVEISDVLLLWNGWTFPGMMTKNPPNIFQGWRLTTEVSGFEPDAMDWRQVAVLK